MALSNRKLTKEDIERCGVGGGGGGAKAFVIRSKYREEYSGKQHVEHTANFTYDEFHDALVGTGVVPAFYWHLSIDYEEMNGTTIDSSTYVVHRPVAIKMDESMYNDDADIVIMTDAPMFTDSNTSHYIRIKKDGAIEVDKFMNPAPF